MHLSCGLVASCRVTFDLAAVGHMNGRERSSDALGLDEEVGLIILWRRTSTSDNRILQLQYTKGCYSIYVGLSYRYGGAKKQTQ